MKTKIKPSAKNGLRNRKSSATAQRSAIEPLEERTLMTSVVVTSTLDSGAGTLRDAINVANTSSTPTTITFSSSVFGSAKTITLNGSQLTLDAKEPVTITGPSAGVTISGNGKSRVFEVDAGVTATFSGLTITKGQAPGNTAEGGGIENLGNLTLSHCTVKGNTAAGTNGEGLGGGIYSSGPLTLTGSTVSSNSASGADEPDGISGYASAGGGIYSTNSLTLSSSTITGNTTAGGVAVYSGFGSSANGGAASGGGIFASSTLTVTSSTVSDNAADGGDTGHIGVSGSGSGGGIYCSASATLTSTTVTGNTAVGGEGAGYYAQGGAASGGGVYGASLVISLSTISGNHADSSLGYIGSAKASGGGIFASKSLSLVQSTVSGNSALGAQGADNGGGNGYAGGQAAGGGIYAAQTLSVNSSTISANSATGGNGDVSSDAPDTTAGVGGNGLGGGVFCQGNAALDDSTIANNSARGGAGGDASFTEPGAKGGNGYGGGIYSTATLKLVNSTLSGNSATGGAGGSDDIVPPYINEPGGAHGSAFGSALNISGGSTLAENTILSGNTGASDVAGTLSASSSYNLVGTGGGLTNGVHGNKVGVTNPKLSALGNNGGPTQTMVPQSGSPALKAGSNSLATAAGLFADQRGLPRISGGTVDIGAVEVQAAGGASIAGTVYNDLNHDGMHEANEPGLSGWQVYVDAANSGVYAGGDITSFTSANGSYKLTGLAAGTYIVREVRLNGWTRSQPAGNYPLGYYKITVAANQAVTGKDFGDYLMS